MVKDVEQQEMILPHSPEAEEAVLAALLLDPIQLWTRSGKKGRSLLLCMQQGNIPAQSWRLRWTIKLFT